MPTINELTAVSAVVASDAVPIYSSANGDARKASMTVLLAFMQANLSFTTQGFGAFVTQYSAPSTTAFNVTITDAANDDSNIHLILTPTAGFANGTITLPAVASCIDKQEILVNCTQVVTALVVDGNGATAVTGEPSALVANDFFRLKYDLATSTWYRVG